MILDEMSTSAKCVAAVVCTAVFGGFVFFSLRGIKAEARRSDRSAKFVHRTLRGRRFHDDSP